MTDLQVCSFNVRKIISSVLILLLYPTIVSCGCTCEVEDLKHDKGEALKYKLEEDLALSELIRRRIISQVLELGIVVHSIIIGISLGASGSPKTIKPLMAALSFHQFFEGMGLGGCITLSDEFLLVFKGTVQIYINGNNGNIFLPDNPGGDRRRYWNL
ncbi:hypothetical protein D5086_020398 [Populus alba]|uniref:Uncharacterized protein n=1 Tax=Populus alba TaxID=43335 RepID=A0ACC4BJY6_POPAL